MIDKSAMNQAGPCASDAAQVAFPFPRKAPCHTARVLRLLRQAVTQLNAPQPVQARRPRAQARSSSAT